MDPSALGLPLLIGLIAVALLFDFLNGLHDAANSIATVVATRVLRPQTGGRVGGVLQFHRVRRVRPARGADGRDGHRQRRCRGRKRDLRRADGRDRVERRHLVARHSVEQQPRADRRTRRRRHREGRHGRGRVQRSRGHGAGHRAVAAARIRARAAARADRQLDQPAGDALRRRSPVPHPAAVFRVHVFARPRRQRRAEDDGHHRGAALLAGDARRRNSTCRSGWC